MAYLAPIPPQLQQVEYTKIYFYLQFRDSFDLPNGALLQLRRELLQAQQALVEQGYADGQRLRQLLQPELAIDPVLRRRIQKPAPAFVLQPDLSSCGLQEAAGRLLLPVLFVGRGIDLVEDFVNLLVQLGDQGLYHGSGRFLLEGVESEDASGVRAMLWSDGTREPLSLPRSDLYWLLERLPKGEQLIIELLSPMRLIHNRKPLFRAGFTDLFPFVLRRVSALLASHAGVELCDDPQPLFELAAKVEQRENLLRWQDWRKLSGSERSQDLGGLLGTLRLAGPELGELYWLLQLASLFNLGKGAPYGAGQFVVKSL